MVTHDDVRGRYKDWIFSLHVIRFEEEGTCYVYVPSLDMFGYGGSAKEAEESFRIVLEGYIDYTTTHNTLREDLKEHGWKIESGRLIAPSFEDIMRGNEVLKAIMKNNSMQMQKQEMRLPAFA